MAIIFTNLINSINKLDRCYVYQQLIKRQFLHFYIFLYIFPTLQKKSHFFRKFSSIIPWLWII